MLTTERRKPLLAAGCGALLLAAVLMAAGPVGATEAASRPERAERYAATASLAIDPAVHGLVRVPLSLDLLRALRSPAHSDLRIFNGAGESLPFAWVSAAGTLASAEPAAERTLLRHFRWPELAGDAPAGEADVVVSFAEGGQIVRVQRRGAVPAAPGGAAARWLVDLPPAAPRPAALWLLWTPTAAGTAATLRVEASADARRWRPVGDAMLLAVQDVVSGQLLELRRVALAPLQAGERYLRLQLSPALALTQVQAEAPAPVATTPLTSTRFDLQRAGPRLWTLDTGAVLPVVRLQVHAKQDNAVLPLAIRHRPGAVAAASGTTPLADGWSQAVAHTAYRLRRDTALVESPPLDIGAVTARGWRFELDARVGPPEAGFEATLWWTPPQLVFAARGPGPFRLAVGRDAAPAVSLERAALLPGYREGDEFALPAVEPGQLIVAAPTKPTLSERLADAGPAAYRRWLLWGVLALAVVVLALLAWRLGRGLSGPAAS